MSAPSRSTIDALRSDVLRKGLYAVTYENDSARRLRIFGAVLDTNTCLRNAISTTTCFDRKEVLRALGYWDEFLGLTSEPGLPCVLRGMMDVFSRDLEESMHFMQGDEK